METTVLTRPGQDASAVTPRERFAAIAITTLLGLLLLALGGSLFEHLVIDAAWPENPALIQPGAGGVDRKTFWIPIHAAITVALVAALWATWRWKTIRREMLLSAALYVAMRLWSAIYFIPVALRFETTSAYDVLRNQAIVEQAWTWVILSTLRSLLLAGAAAFVWVAARRVNRPRFEERRSL